jgi:hypothetical protein
MYEPPPGELLMDTDHLREAARQHPFRPFTLRLNDGREFHVPHPEFIAVSKRMVVVHDTATEVFIMVEPMLIASFQYDPPKVSTEPKP